MSEVEGVNGEMMELCELEPKAKQSADDESQVVVLATVHSQGVHVFRKIWCTGERLQDSVETTLRSNVELEVEALEADMTLAPKNLRISASLSRLDSET